MLYTFSQADYPYNELENHLAHATAQDAVVLWQDGVLLAVKYPELFSHCQADCYALEIDVVARGLTEFFSPSTKVRSISLLFLVRLTERYTPQYGM